MFAGSTIPSGWALCGGQAISRTTYSKLFEVLGTTYGAGDGSTTFNLPDLRDKFPVGAGSSYALNAQGGSADAIIPYHNHDVDTVNIGSSGNHTHSYTTYSTRDIYNYASKDTPARFSATTSTISSSGAHTHTVPAHSTKYAGTDGNVTNANLPPYIGINYIIYTGV